MDLLVVGLGNPGERYAETRHNIGFRVVDRLARRLGISFRKPLFRPLLLGEGRNGEHGIDLVKPQTFMNKSGDILPFLFRKTGLGIDNLVVVCDTLDLPPGTIRLKLGGSSAGHNGLKSLMAVSSGRGEFLRLYIGIGRPDTREEVIPFVLGAPDRNELPVYERAVGEASECILRLSDTSPEQIMNEINRKDR